MSRLRRINAKPLLSVGAMPYELLGRRRAGRYNITEICGTLTIMCGGCGAPGREQRIYERDRTKDGLLIYQMTNGDLQTTDRDNCWDSCIQYNLNMVRYACECGLILRMTIVTYSAVSLTGACERTTNPEGCYLLLEIQNDV